MKELFITATDTDAGKTFVSCAIIYALSQQVNTATNKNLKIAAFKPIAAGCDLVDGQLINEDAKLLCDFANCGQSIQQINPIAFAEAIAPHIAAKKHNRTISIADINKHYQKIKNQQVKNKHVQSQELNQTVADVVLVEGAGGWRLPIGISQKNKSNFGYQFLSDFVAQTKLDVILIVNMKLGCLNHALLTFEAIKADGLNCIAWIANSASSEPMSNLSENITELEQLLPIPKIAQFDFFADVDEKGNALSFEDKIHQAAKQINLAPILS